MDAINYYKVLDVSEKATPHEIKKAYRKLARKFHPDFNPNNVHSEQNFQMINEANSVLSDPEKRKKYDQHGKDWEHAEEFEKAKRSQSSQRRTHRSSPNGGDFSDFFESMFGAGAGQERHVRFRGEDYRASLQLSFIEAYTTHQQTLTVNGKAIRITIPAGIENGQTIKIKNHGDTGMNGGPHGDLYLTFSISDHPDFKRLGKDLYLTKELNLYTAILGGELIIDTLSGRIKLKVKPETQNGEKVKLKGKGFPIYKKEGAFGDLYVTYTVNIPTGLTDKQKALFIELSKT